MKFRMNILETLSNTRFENNTLCNPLPGILFRLNFFSCAYIPTTHPSTTPSLLLHCPALQKQELCLYLVPQH